GGAAATRFGALVSPEPVPEKPQVPAREITAVVDPATQEPEPAIQIEPVHIGSPNGALNLTRQLRRDPLVGIDNQHPLVAPRHVLQRPIFLSGKLTIPVELHHLSPGRG